MSKTTTKTLIHDLSRYCKSTFTLTFAVEILGLNVFDDCGLGWMDLGLYVQAMKIQYQLSPGHTYDLDILIWPHVAKIWCGNDYGWVRTWQYLERRWLTFSIRHAFPVRVMELQHHEATVTPNIGVGLLGANAKNDKDFHVLIPPLEFGERRYFAPVHSRKESLWKFIWGLIWNLVAAHIPASYLDGIFDVPTPVFDVRHQDASLFHVQEAIFKRVIPDIPESEQESTRKVKNEAHDVPKAPAKAKFEIILKGDSILSGIGRIIPFGSVGERPSDLGEIIVLISSNNLPAQDDYPVVFVNVDRLCDIPTNEFKALSITNLYTRWSIGEEVHDSETKPITSKKDYSFQDHHAIPLNYDLVSRVMADFNEEFEIQLRGQRTINQNVQPYLFGDKSGDRNYDASVPKPNNTLTDFIIAVTKIRTEKLAGALNNFINGEYPLYPPMVSVRVLDREGVCTNDINGIKIPIEPRSVVKPDVVLMAQMTLEVSIGLVGCKPNRHCPSFSRMFCLTKDSKASMFMLKYITSVNEEARETDELLTGFVLDTGDVALLFVEGPKDGNILRVWDMTEDFYPVMKPVFSCSARYSTRIYPELLAAAIPFTVLKMFVPLGVLLACPPVYARPALPLPARAAVLKIGRLLAGKLRNTPFRTDMPTGAELTSFRLELCVAPTLLPINFAEMEQDSTPT